MLKEHELQEYANNLKKWFKLDSAEIGENHVKLCKNGITVEHDTSGVEYDLLDEDINLISEAWYSDGMHELFSDLRKNNVYNVCHVYMSELYIIILLSDTVEIYEGNTLKCVTFEDFEYDINKNYLTYCKWKYGHFEGKVKYNIDTYDEFKYTLLNENNNVRKFILTKCNKEVTLEISDKNKFMQTIEKVEYIFGIINNHKTYVNVNTGEEILYINMLNKLKKQEYIKSIPMFIVEIVLGIMLSYASYTLFLHNESSYVLTLIMTFILFYAFLWGLYSIRHEYNKIYSEEYATLIEKHIEECTKLINIKEHFIREISNDYIIINKLENSNTLNNIPVIIANKTTDDIVDGLILTGKVDYKALKEKCRSLNVVQSKRVLFKGSIELYELTTNNLYGIFGNINGKNQFIELKNKRGKIA